MPWHHLFLVVYEWLVNQNLWKAAVSWVVGITLGATFIQRPWRKHKLAQRQANKLTHDNQNAIIDQLDPTTPGGIEQVVLLQKKILDELASHRKDSQ